MSAAMSHVGGVEMPDKMEAHRLRREEKDAIHGKVLLEGAKMGMITTTGAIAASLAAQRYLPAYRRLTLPFRISLVLFAATAGFFTETDRAAMRADREFAQKFSITTASDISSTSASSAVTAAGILSSPLTLRNWDTKAAKDLAFKNRFTLLSWAYAGIVGSTLAYNFSRTDIFMSQKFINARLVGQFSAVAGILLIGAAVSAGSHKEEELDPYYERIVNGGGDKKATV